jgi:S1-C subfamily serine protease
VKAFLATVAVLLAGCGGGGGPAVLDVHVPDGEATAFAIGGGRAITAAHVLRGHRPVRVAGSEARVLRVDRRLDVAVLGVGARGGPAARAGRSRAGARVSVRVLRDGAPRSLAATVRRTISAHVRDPRGRVRIRPALELAVTVVPGDSGAPVVDGDGRVVGVVFAQASGSEALAYALDARALGSLLAHR